MPNWSPPRQQTLMGRAAMKRKAARSRRADADRLEAEADDLEREYWAWKGKQAAKKSA